MYNLKIGINDVYTANGPLGLSSLWELHKVDRPELKDEGFQPCTPASFSPYRGVDLLNAESESSLVASSL